jgi:2-keto-4-pentenoate hydratase/2-oxohepta-3-ene-1,7-dioic acid hydratase in catechol pathway
MHKPPAWLKPGSTVVVEVEGLGRLSNPIIEGPAQNA